MGTDELSRYSSATQCLLTFLVVRTALYADIVSSADICGPGRSISSKGTNDIQRTTEKYS